MLNIELVALIKVTAVLCLVMNCCSSDYIVSKGTKFPTQKVHAFFRNFNHGKRNNQNYAVWSEWGPWSDCSRTCGGGVMTQTRFCISKPTENTRFFQKFHKRRRNSSINGCIGLYKRIQLCNMRECPFGTDFRQEQCSFYDSKKFKGKTYEWKPFIRVEEECALNCRPTGMNFFATLNKTVIDGTFCFNPVTSYGKLAPKGTKGICVSGTCKSVDSRGVVGSVDESSTSECPACTKGFCRSINGIYTRSNLPPGYSFVAKIPKGACRILVQQLKHSKNFIALRRTNGSFLINGDYRFSSTSRSFDGVGTEFAYIKQDSSSLETISSPGPLEAPLEIYLVTYQPNLGIKYGYLLPNDPVERQIAPPSVKISNKIHHQNDNGLLGKSQHKIDPNTVETKIIERNHSDQHDDPKFNHHHRQRRLRRYRFLWKTTGITACSKTCGGGIQTTVVSCVRELTQTPVPDKRCAHIDKPPLNPIKCNIQDCPPKWTGYWSPCSVSCGTGVQKYIIQCKQELSIGREVILDDVQCLNRPKPLIKTQTCTNTPCDVVNNEVPRNPEFRSATKPHDEWEVGEWSSCSVSCGIGHRTRLVTCPSNNCRTEHRPIHAEYCTLPSCVRNSANPSEISPWLVTEWSKCSEECGTGKQTRYAVCGKDTCDISSKPESSRDCSSEKQCGGKWFAGPWGECTNSCSGSPHQNREVLCVVKVKGQYRITNDMTCPNHLKPANTQSCIGKCEPFWFIGDWAHCENCPNGIQKRQVKCMDINGIPSSSCHETDVPSSKRPCDCHHKREDKDRYRPAHDQPIEQNCVDKIRNCYMAVQARLCQYSYYKNQCCVSCTKAQQDQLLQ